MKLIEFLQNSEKIDEESVLYVNRIDGEFSSESEVKILNLTEEELEWKPIDVTEKKCPGFEYFIEAGVIKEFMQDVSSQNITLQKKCTRLIQYVELDA